MPIGRWRYAANRDRGAFGTGPGESDRKLVRWIAGGGAFVVALDSIINMAFPAMARAFHTPPEAMRWVIVSYVLTYALMSFVGGTLGDIVGHARVFQVGAALCVVAFVVCGLAPTFGVLLGGRVLQGLGSGLVYGTAPGILTLTAPPGARGRAVGLFNAAVGLGALGPLVAGAIVETFGWPFVFLLRVPLGLALVAWAFVALPRGRLASGYRLMRAGDIARARVVVACALSFVANAGIFAIWLLAPFFLVELRGLPVTAAGAVFMLTSLAMMVTAPLAGRVTDRLGGRSLIAGGLLLEAAGLLSIGHAGATTPVWMLATAFAVAGVGLGAFQVPNMALIMGAFGADQQGAAGGLALLARTLGIVTGVLALAHIFAVRRLTVGFEPAFAEAFVTASAAVALAAILGMVPLREREAQRWR
jgi:MFS family permease